MTRRRRTRYIARPLDQNTASESFSRPGIDPRQWISYGVVTTDENDQVVDFDEEDGQPYVAVVLKPSEVSVRARVAGSIAGSGEGEWNPFVQGDEVIVALPEGREDAGAVIIGRLNNALDKFPMESVAGQDPTTNTFAFRRRRTPFIEEYAGPVVFRSALSSALISIGTDGAITLKDGENSALQISADLIGFQGPSEPGSAPEYVLQMDLTNERFNLQINDALLSMGGSGASSQPGTTLMAIPNELQLIFGTNQPGEHVATVEFVLGCLAVYSNAVGLLSPALLALSTAIAAGGVSITADPGISGALQTGLVIAGALPKPPPVNGVQQGQTLGAVRFRVG